MANSFLPADRLPLSGSTKVENATFSNSIEDKTDPAAVGHHHIGGLQVAMLPVNLIDANRLHTISERWARQ